VTEEVRKEGDGCVSIDNLNYYSKEVAQKVSRGRSVPHLGSCRGGGGQLCFRFLLFIPLRLIHPLRFVLRVVISCRLVLRTITHIRVGHKTEVEIGIMSAGAWRWFCCLHCFELL